MFSLGNVISRQNNHYNTIVYKVSATQIVYDQLLPAANNCVLQTLGTRVFQRCFLSVYTFTKVKKILALKKSLLPTIFLDIKQNSHMKFSIIPVYVFLRVVDGDV